MKNKLYFCRQSFIHARRLAIFQVMTITTALERCLASDAAQIRLHSDCVSVRLCDVGEEPKKVSDGELETDARVWVAARD